MQLQKTYKIYLNRLSFFKKMQKFKLDNSVSFYAKAVLMKHCAIIFHIHIGYEEALNKRGFLVPRTFFKEIFKETQRLLKRIRPKKLIVAGDLKHEFGRISDQEWKDTFEFIDLVKKHCDLILLKGNHDKVLYPITDKRNVDIKDHVMIDDHYVCHGDVIPDDKDFIDAKKIIVGHEHPCISIRDEHKTEKFKTFLFGEYKNKEVIVMPSFNPVEGVDVTRERLLCPFLNKNPRFWDFKTYVTADKIYEFGLLKSLR